MMVKWPDLMAEFDRWEEAGKVATLWWRDDDAVAPTARLGRLLSIASGVPISLAVIPADARTGACSVARPATCDRRRRRLLRFFSTVGGI